MSTELRFNWTRQAICFELRSTGQPPTSARKTYAVSQPRQRASVAAWVVLCGSMLWSAAGTAQETTNPLESSLVPSLTDAVRELGKQVKVLQASVAEMRSESERARAETRELRRELEELRAGSSEQRAVVMEAVARTQNSSGAISAGSLQDSDQDQQRKAAHAANLEEEYDLLSGKVDDQYQTKVESASKYRMRISGIVLTNLFSNQGTVDNIDLPTLAYARPAGFADGSIGATLRQSQIGFEVFGPRLGGARTRADLQLDLAGGFPSIPNGINSGLMRLRTATMRIDWNNTSVVAGQDGLFFSPNSPTSFASLAQPALSYAGNLWSWVPQVRVEHRVVLAEASSLLFQAGILDPVSGEVPTFGSYRQPGPGESSRQPAFGTRVAWTHDVFGQPLRVGVAGFYSRQDYGFARRLDAWAAMSDLELPLSRQFSLSGKLYRGKGLGGLYGGIGRSVLFSGDPANAYTNLIGLNSVGGWAQLKYRPEPKLELNAAFGLDNPYARDLEYFPYPQSYGDPTLARNRGSFGNVIYRPRSDLLFSAEYRRITTDAVGNGAASAGHVNLMMGVLF
jgi:hypothetical protein